MSESNIKLLRVGGITLTLVPAIIVTLVVPRFIAVYEGYGAALPNLTSWVVQGYLCIWLLPMLALGFLLGSSDRAQGARLSLYTGLFGLLGCLPTVVFALYLPIFRLADTVG